ncbi:MAG: hypothetical protein ABSB23_01120 [Bryobacteraceae bacterium]|jgi:hypothetical protein
MNRTLLALCATLVVCVVALTLAKAQTATTPSAQGRYLLYNLEYAAYSNSTAVKEKGVFRIDTQTGETKEFVEALTADGKLVSKWMAVEDK